MSRTAVRAYGAACAAGGVLVVAGWLLPGVVLHLSGYIGAGSTQQSFDFDRTIALASQHSWRSFALPAAGLSIVILAAFGVAVPRARPSFVVVAGIAAAALIHFEQTTEFTDYGEGGVYACDRATAHDPGACSGALLRPAFRDFAEDIRSSAVGRRRGFVLQDGYRAKARAVKVVEWSLVAVLLVAAYASIRIVRRWWTALLLLVAATIVVLAWLAWRSLSRLE